MRKYLLLTLVLFSLRMAAQNVVTSHVIDAENGDAMPYVRVTVSDSVTTITNYDGDFSIMAQPDDVLHLHCIGYQDLTVRVSKLPKKLKMKPLGHSMSEVSVIAWENKLRQISKKLNKEFDRHKGHKSQYFFRMTNKWTNMELIEAFVSAKSVNNLRDISILKGRHGRITQAGLSRPMLADINFHHPLELGPLSRGSMFWSRLLTPITSNPSADLTRLNGTYIDYLVRNYNVDGEELVDSTGQKILKINILKKDTTFIAPNGIMTGTLYADAKTLDLLRFDGEVQDISVDVAKDFKRITGTVKIQLHIDYTHQHKYTEVSTMAVSINSGDLQNRCLLFNVDDLKLGIQDKGKQTQENMLASIDDAGFDKILWAHSNIVQRTEEEEQTEPLMAMQEKQQPSLTHPSMERIKQSAFSEVGQRLLAFGTTIPQEKVYLHMDNTCYFAGDTIWFSAYTVQTSDGKPSNVSGVLYAELYNQEGYLVERKLIEMRNGRGHGNFALADDSYGGFYELRAYTRWQLNWGVYQHHHSKVADNWFLTKEQEQQHYRDYDKIYSRVFPVYDKPSTPGSYVEEMTQRPMRRYFKKDPSKHELLLSLYPEGGNLVEGLPCRVAYEATMEDGQQMEGSIGPDSTLNRGRGYFEVTPERGFEREVTFISKDGKKAKAKLPKAETEGISLRIDQQTAGTWTLRLALSPTLSADSIALTIMHEGKVETFSILSELAQTDSLWRTLTLSSEDLPVGVNQVTVFNPQGRIYADRLFFVTHPDFLTPTVSIQGLKPVYEPYESVQLKLKNNCGHNGSMSLAVRDAHSDLTFDTSDLLIELLLSSEIKGFVPNPQWFFQKDDAEHRQGLDLLMMTQGWRRFNWRDMAVRGEWDLTQPAERTPIIKGRVYDVEEGAFSWSSLQQGRPAQSSQEQAYLNFYNASGRDEHLHIIEKDDSDPLNPITVEIQAEKELNIITSQWNDDDKTRNPKQLIKVHAELVSTDGKETHTLERITRDGRFQFLMPGFYGNAILFLSAADSATLQKTERKHKRYTWVQAMPDESDGPARRINRVDNAPVSVRVDFPYARFVKPYNYYQEQLRQAADPLLNRMKLADGTIQMREVFVGAKRNGLKGFSDSIPAIIIDGYDAYNQVLDGGFLAACQEAIVRNVVGDYGSEFPFIHDRDGLSVPNIEVRYGDDFTRRVLNNVTTHPDSIYMHQNLHSRLIMDRWGDIQANITPREMFRYGCHNYVDRYVIYTDYEPRREGDRRYLADNLPLTSITVYPFPDDSRRIFYRDRRYVLQGYSYADDFYHPNYEQRTPQQQPEDYRRTIYWNPDLRFDSNGEATVRFYNNCRPNQLSISAEGIAEDGTVLNGQIQ